jgi:hypothetical protein
VIKQQWVDARVTVRVNNGEPLAGEFRIARPVDIVMSLGAKPDPHWEMVDSNGHYHAYSTEPPAYPTLDNRTERVGCDGSCGDEDECEGYSITRRVCRICQEEITPGVISGPHRFEIPGLWEWSVILDGHMPTGRLLGGGTVSVCIDHGDERRWGIAIVTDLYVSSFGECRAELMGSGSLGRREGARQH